MPDTEILPKPEAAPATADPAVSRGWKVLLYNDEVHSYEAVVLALQRAAGLSLEVAEMVAFEAHSEDRAVVKQGLDRDEALVICAGLRRWTRIEGATDGVDCEAVREDE